MSNILIPPPLRDPQKTPSLYQEGDRVMVQHWWHQPKAGSMERHDKYYAGVVTRAGLSEHNIAYDWYTVVLDNGELIESWWMTTWKIVQKLNS